MWDPSLPTRIEPRLPALHRGFLTNEIPGKSLHPVLDRSPLVIFDDSQFIQKKSGSPVVRPLLSVPRIQVFNETMEKLFTHLFAMKWWNQLPWSLFFACCFKLVFSLFSFTFIKRLFSSSLLSAIRVVSSTYLRVLIILPGMLIPACAASSLGCHMMYSV